MNIKELVENPIKKQVTMQIIEEKGDAEKRILTFIGTNETKDRVNEVLTIDGWNTKNYMTNPVFLWAHDKTLLPIGKTIKLYKRDGNMIFKIEFADEETFPFADTVYKLYKKGFLNAVSVGYIPDIKSMEYDEKTDTLYTRKKELLELSAVPVGCNPSALQQRDIEDMNAKGINDKDIVRLRENSKNKPDNNFDTKEYIREAVKEILNEQPVKKSNIFDDILSLSATSDDNTDEELSEIINNFKNNFEENNND